MTNIQRLTDYINQQEDPERFLNALFALLMMKEDDSAEREKAGG